MMRRAPLLITLLVGAALSPLAALAQASGGADWQPEFDDWIPGFAVAETSAMRQFGTKALQEVVENIDGEPMELWLNYFIRPTQRAEFLYVEVFSTNAFAQLRERLDQPPFRVVSANFPGILVQLNEDLRIKGRGQVFVDLAKAEPVAPVVHFLFGSQSDKVDSCTLLTEQIGEPPYAFTVGLGLPSTSQSDWPLVAIPGLDTPVYRNPASLIGPGQINASAYTISTENGATVLLLLNERGAGRLQDAIEAMPDAVLVLGVNGLPFTVLAANGKLRPGPVAFSGGRLTEEVSRCLQRATNGN